MFEKIKLKKAEQSVEDANLSEKDLDEMRDWSDEDFEDPKKIKKQLKRTRSRRKSKKQVVRVEDVQKILAEHGESVDAETVISMYMPRRRIKRLGAALLRLDKIKLLALALVALIAILFIISFSQEKMGNFTINLDRLELYRKGISIDDDPEFSQPTARLTASALKDATNITVTDLPSDINDVDGDHNGSNYVAFTYYVRNAGKESLKYKAVVKLVSSSKKAENAARVAVYRNNGERTVYAEPNSAGNAESGTVAFKNHKTACQYDVENFDVGYVDKYTVVIWLEGEDPDCVDSIIGGSIQFEMDIESYEQTETSLFKKFIQDIGDTISGDKPIGISGRSAPDYYNSGNVTWSTRLNK